MRPGPIVAAMLIAAASSPAIAQDMISGGDTEAILEVVRAKGSGTLAKQQNGNPRIVGRIDGVQYHIYFMGCDGGTCEDVNFYAGFGGNKPPLDLINEWNRDKRFGNAYLDADLDAVIELDVNLETPVSREYFASMLDVWVLLLSQFTEFIGHER
jgi:hypothetical protein